MLPQMALTPCLAFTAVLLLCISFSVNPQSYNYPIASAPASWTNSPSLPHNLYLSGGGFVRSLLLWLNSTQDMSFSTEFYCFPLCKSFFLSISIIYAYNDNNYGYNVPPQVIWSANRANPVSENATLQLTCKDGLTLHDRDGRLVWSTSGLNRSVAGINNTEAGNLVLFDINNSTIWQSFDHPTDSLVMEQTLAGGMRLIANSSSTNLAESQFYLTLLAPIWLKNHLMLELNDVSYFNNINYNGSFNTTDRETCKFACLGDCNCKASLFWSSDRTCLTVSEVFTFKNQPNAFSEPSINIKVQASSSKLGLGVILGSTFGALFFMVTLTSIYILCLRRLEEEQDEDMIEQLPGMSTRFTFEELRVATENFIKILGKGGFGTVFEGRWGDERIAVKRLDNVVHGKKDFLAEVETIGSIHHINLVRMIGFCADKLNRLLVYEYMCNGSLDQWIYCRDGRVPLDWTIRFKIITDIAKDLCYLHEECKQKIVHFDIKSENIFLDENFNAKISEFGLSKLVDRDISRVMTKMRDTPGYLAPEWLTAMVTEKVDVYSFGVVVMEILSGRRNLDDSLTEENRHLIKLLEEKSKSNGLSYLIDKNLVDVELFKKDIVNVMKLAMWCLQWDSTRRPLMLIVVKVLDGVMEVETSLDYNFVSSIPMIASIPTIVDQLDPLPTSMLSGPR